MSVIADSCQIASLLSKEITTSLENATLQAKIDFLSNHHKLLKRLFRIFGRLLKSSAISFYVLHVFGNQVFLDFVKQVLRLVSYIAKPLFESFPDKKDEVVLFLHDFASIVAQMLSDSLEAEDVGRYFSALFEYFGCQIENMLFNSFQTNFADDYLLSNVLYVVATVMTETHESLKIFVDDEAKKSRITQILEGTTKLASDFAVKMIEYALTLNMSCHTLNNYAEILFYLFVGYSNCGIVMAVETGLIQLHPNVSPNALNDLFKMLSDGIKCSIKPMVKEKFQTNFHEFLKKLKEYLSKTAQKF